MSNLISMKGIKTIILAGSLAFYSAHVFSQELNCRVTINTSQIQGTNKQLFNTLTNAIIDFMNNTTWTNHVFEMNERIECNLFLNVVEAPLGDIIKGTLQIQARRPIYGSSYNSVMLNYIDEDVQFKYAEFDPLEFSDKAHLSNLTSILAYYAYIILALDYDSYSLNGGSPYLQKAEKIVTNAQNSTDPGWKAFESKGRDNRYWLVTNMMDEEYSLLREFNYLFHRQGLDVMDESPEKGKMMIRDAVTKLERFYNNKPDPFMHYFQVVLDSKAEEIVQVFSQAAPEDKKKIYDIMIKIDPANLTKYTPLKQ